MSTIGAVISSVIDTSLISNVIASDASISVFGITKQVYDGTGEVTSNPSANTYHQMNLTTIDQGTLTNITSNNDGSYTNNNSSSIQVMGIITAMGGNSTARRFQIGAATDNSGSIVIIEDEAGENLAIGSIRQQNWHMYSVTLDAGKTVYPMTQSHSGTNNFTCSTFEHFIWN